jgi:hypothetical protein
MVRNANLHELLQTGTRSVRLRLVDPNLKQASRQPTCRQSRQSLRLSISSLNFVLSIYHAVRERQCFNFSSPRAQKIDSPDNILNFLKKQTDSSNRRQGHAVWTSYWRAKSRSEAEAPSPATPATGGNELKAHKHYLNGLAATFSNGATATSRCLTIRPSRRRATTAGNPVPAVNAEMVQASRSRSKDDPQPSDGVGPRLPGAFRYHEW